MLDFLNGYFSDEKIRSSISNLSKMLPDNRMQNKGCTRFNPGDKITSDFSFVSLKRIVVEDVDFIKCYFCSSAANGSKFFGASFQSSDFSGAAFQNCIFDNVRFEHGRIIGAGFSHSIFIDCTFNETVVAESTFFDCFFENCVFDGAQIKYATFENSVMKRGMIKHADLSQTNLEFLEWDGLALEDVLLPAYQIPYIIGAFDCLSNQNLGIYVFTDSGNLHFSEYKELLMI